MLFITNDMHKFHSTCFDPKSSHVRNMALTTSISSFTSIALKSQKKQPCGKTMQFSTWLHYQVHKRCQTKLVRGCLSTIIYLFLTTQESSEILASINFFFILNSTRRGLNFQHLKIYIIFAEPKKVLQQSPRKCPCFLLSCLHPNMKFN